MNNLSGFCDFVHLLSWRLDVNVRQIQQHFFLSFYIYFDIYLFQISHIINLLHS